ncbi:MAG TPA: N-methyl-L-tryptophan oxidase [Longimicrobiales bacterium]|nr:N-methyl-L-tryptophan oxidase [Longimicrobiales bacterium]
METRTDVLVVGLGVTGAALCHELARRGADVVGVDRHEPPHGLGASHGRSRIIREAYFEHPLYVPLVQRAYELWAELEELTGAVLYRRTGGLMVGPADGRLVTGSLASARDHGLPHEMLDAGAIRSRFPGLHPEADWVGVFEPRAGALMPELCVRTLLDLARGHGAVVHTGTSVDDWRVVDDGDVVVGTSAGTIRARRLVLAAGPWMNAALAMERGPALQLPFAVERQVSHWFAPGPGLHAFRPDSCPVVIWEYGVNRLFYTFPDLGHGVKAGIHHEGIPADPDTVDRVVGMGEEQRMRRLLDAYMPGAAHTALTAEVCLYTNTPDGDFVIDRHPQLEQVMLVSACSGHGFKFAPAVAEVVVDELLEGGSAFDLEPFRVSRLL